MREHMSRILRQLQNVRFIEFAELFDTSRGVPVVVVNFIAMLELARESLIEITQPEPFAPIYVRLATCRPEARAPGLALFPRGFRPFRLEDGRHGPVCPPSRGAPDKSDDRALIGRSAANPLQSPTLATCRLRASEPSATRPRPARRQRAMRRGTALPTMKVISTIQELRDQLRGQNRTASCRRWATCMKAICR